MLWTERQHKLDNTTKQIKFRKAEILGFRVEKINLSGGRVQPKLIIQVKVTKTNQIFEISEIFFAKDGNEVCQGLWINLNENGDVAPKSTLNALLNFYDIDNLEQLTGLVVKIRQNTTGYYTIDCTESVLNN